MKTIPPHLQGTSYSFTNQYDEFGRMIQESSPDGGWTSYQYSITGTLASGNQYIQKRSHVVGGAADLDHYTTTYVDGLSRAYAKSETGSAGQLVHTSATLDTLDRVERSYTPHYSSETAYYAGYAYDGLSRVIDTTAPDGHHVTTSYRGLTTVATDQNGHAKTSTNDTLGRMKTVQDHGTVLGYWYDLLGNPVQVVAAAGMREQKITTMAYDPRVSSALHLLERRNQQKRQQDLR